MKQVRVAPEVLAREGLPPDAVGHLWAVRRGVAKVIFPLAYPYTMAIDVRIEDILPDPA